MTTASTTRTATGRFDLTQWDEERYAEADGVALATASIAKTFEGAVAGTSTARVLLAYAQHGSAAYVGIEQVTAAVDGRSGSFVLQHTASGSAAGGTMSVTVVPDSGTGDLTGIAGEMVIVNDGGEHTYAFTYRLDG